MYVFFCIFCSILLGAENIAYKNDRRALSGHINCHLFGSCGIWSGRHGCGSVYLCSISM